MNITLHPAINTIVQTIRGIGGRVFIVGGAVRDAYMGLVPDDIDLEVFNVSGKVLHDILSTIGHVTVAGKFSIFTFHIDGLKYDFSLPRRDSKVGRGYTAFEFTVDPYMTLEEAASRRDYTINSMMVELPDMFVYDFFGGRRDIDNRVLRATSEHFSEDPMRVIRGFSFAGRFGLGFDIATTEKAIMLLSEADTLDSNLLYKHWAKWALGDHPAHALFELVCIGWDMIFPALFGLSQGVPQDPEWHPEGDAWQHTLHVVTAMRHIINRNGITDKDTQIVLMLAALLHDVGKAVTTVEKDGRIISPGHAEAGISIAQQFLHQIGIPNRITVRVLPLIREHMAHISMADITSRAVRRLAIRVSPANIEELMMLIEADHSGRPPLPKGLPDKAREISELSKVLVVDTGLPKPILMGRHLIELGMKPNKSFGDILDNAFEQQLNGIITDVESGKAWVINQM